MAIYIMTDADVNVNAVSLSDHVESVSVSVDAEDVDITAMGATSRAHAPGLRDDTVTVNFFQDFAASEIDATLFPLVGNQTGVAVIVKPTSAAVSTTNPSFTATMVLLSYQPISGTIGAASQTSVTFACAQGSSIAKATA